jgi:hypothetical protein
MPQRLSNGFCEGSLDFLATGWGIRRLRIVDRALVDSWSGCLVALILRTSTYNPTDPASPARRATPTRSAMSPQTQTWQSPETVET